MRDRKRARPKTVEDHDRKKQDQRKKKKKRKHRNIHFVLPGPKCPWSPAELDRLIEDAREFIRRRQKAHARGFGWEVGEHLFFGLYRGDEEYLRRLDPSKPDSLGDVSRGTGVPYSTLYLYTMATVVRHKLAQAGVEPDLDLRHFGVLDEISDHLEALVALARWAERNGISTRELKRAVKLWRRHLDEGGSLEELEADLVSPHHKKRKRTRPTSHKLLRSTRLLMVVDAWTRKRRLSRKYAGRIRERLLRIRSLLVEAAP
ncbi:MAG: hypothetical protein JRG91_12785 [Deltaproteobacteria bacterium]|nr:hypothetical protein [Deltaproteobacteria bacterium]